ncbi:catalase family peroxidase [Pseudoalteromonas sp. BZB3]|uniref:catalase family peroxidase n=1 Tax=Pseudoalteromonas sp. BZB3 TaxID=3136670 RepID=UPI0032C43060
MTTHTYVYSAAVALIFSGQIIAAPEKPVSANEFIQLFEKLNGKHPGVRKAHVSGVCAIGEFQPNTQINLFKNAPLLSSGALPVTIRFSMGGGNPIADERTTGTRGMGMQINLPGGARHIFTGNNFPIFAGKDPETFFGFLSTLLPDESGKRDPKKTQEYIKNNPSVQGNVAWNAQAKTPASYANTEFFGLHTFFYGNGAEQVKFRWQLTPDLGVKTLSKEQAQQLKSTFLADKLANQLTQGTVSFTLNAVIGEKQDVVNNPSVQWPADRTQVALGKVVLKQSGGDACTPINFDPNVISQGFTASDDPVLKMRSMAYAISFGKRLSGQ